MGPRTAARQGSRHRNPDDTAAVAEAIAAAHIHGAEPATLTLLDALSALLEHHAAEGSR